MSKSEEKLWFGIKYLVRKRLEGLKERSKQCPGIST